MYESGVRRGEIFYIDIKTKDTEGNEIRKSRPAVIVSQDRNNLNSGTVEVVYMTAQEKSNAPYHVTIKEKPESGIRESTALCEQITTISKERVGDPCGCCTEEEMAAIDKAMLVSLGIDETKVVLENFKAQPLTVDPEPEMEGITKIETERDLYKRLYEELLEKVVK